MDFYPDPADFPDDVSEDVDKPNVDHFRYWYSEEGHYRLEDKNHVSTSGHFAFELKTPNGLVFEFERYKHDLDAKRESMALHFRVTKISDRNGNYLSISYVNLDGIPDLRPDKVEAFSNAGGTALHTIDYGYLVDGRLTSIQVPGFGTGVNNVYRFYYPDTGTLHPDMPARHFANSVVASDIAPFQDDADWRAPIPKLASDIAGFGVSDSFQRLAHDLPEFRRLGIRAGTHARFQHHDRC